MGEGERASRLLQTRAFMVPSDCISSLSHRMGEGQGDGDSTFLFHKATASRRIGTRRPAACGTAGWQPALRLKEFHLDEMIAMIVLKRDCFSGQRLSVENNF